MSFLSIPSQRGLFTTIKAGKTNEGEGARARSHPGDDNNVDEEDEDDDDNVRLIPRGSPIPRKRGASIYEETAEYLRFHLALAAGKKVSFADTTGRDLVDVREFVAFDSDEDEGPDLYQAPQGAPTYTIHRDFEPLTPDSLLRAVRQNKVEVEHVSSLQDEPLSFSGLVRVMNVSFHKAVYIRSTMDGWASYFDHPAEYVHGSHDGETDQFLFKLCFAPPYNTHGSRIEFVVRYETSEGDFWANNSALNYGMTLLVSFEEDIPPVPSTDELQQIRGILRPPKAYRNPSNDDPCPFDPLSKQMLFRRTPYLPNYNDDPSPQEERQLNEGEPGDSGARLIRPIPVCPHIIEPEINVETVVHPCSSTSSHGSPCLGDTPSTHILLPAKHLPHMSSNSSPQANAAFEHCQ